MHLNDYGQIVLFPALESEVGVYNITLRSTTNSLSANVATAYLKIAVIPLPVEVILPPKDPKFYV